MSRKIEALESLLESYDLMMKGVSAAELAKSGLFSTWLQQVSSTLVLLVTLLAGLMGGMP